MIAKTLVISDIDGCLTNGKFVYTSDGKVSKEFGAGDHEGVKLLKLNNIDIQFITADKIGWDISKKRIDDMNCQLDLVKEKDRIEYIEDKFNDYDYVIFFGDGIGDAYKAKRIDKLYFITPKNGRPECKERADYVTPNNGGEGAFLDLAIEVLKHPTFYYGDVKYLY